MSSVHIYLFIGLFIGFIYYKTKKYLRKQNEPILNDFESKQLITPTNCENCVTTKIIDENSGLFVQVKSNDIIINIDDNFLEQNIKSTDSMNLTNSVDMDIDLSDSDSVDLIDDLSDDFVILHNNEEELTTESAFIPLLLESTHKYKYS